MNERYASLDKNNKLIWNFRDIAHTMHQIAEGKSSQKRILILLHEAAENPLTQKELTERLGVQPGTVSEVLSKLETAGLILRTPSFTDRRTTTLHLTELGKVQAQEAAFQRSERHQQMFFALSEQEKQTLLQLLEKLNDDWDQIYRKHEVD